MRRCCEHPIQVFKNRVFIDYTAPPCPHAHTLRARGPVWLATPSPCETLIGNASPALPAHSEPLGPSVSYSCPFETTSWPSSTRLVPFRLRVVAAPWPGMAGPLYAAVILG